MIGKKKVDWVDALFASHRQTIIIRMFNAGQLDADEAARLYARTTDLDIVQGEREALEQNRAGDPETHLGTLGLHFFKRRGKEG